MPNRRAARRPGAATLPRWTSWIWSVTAVYLAVGLVTLVQSLMSGRFRALELLFRYPGAALMVALSAAAVWFSLQVLREFSPGEPLRLGWRLIALAALCSVFSTLCVQVLSTSLVSRLFDQQVMQAGGAGSLIQKAGVLAGGTIRFTLLTAALWNVLRIYRQSGLLPRFEAMDWVVLAGIALYVGLETRETVLAIRAGMRPPLGMVLGWPTDLLLLGLSAEALLLYRSARQMRPGLIGKCWQSIAIGTFLVTLGNVLLWAARSSYLPWPWSALEWYVWLPAEAAFALAPLYQLQAVYAARSSRRTP